MNPSHMKPSPSHSIQIERYIESKHVRWDNSHAICNLCPTLILCYFLHITVISTCVLYMYILYRCIIGPIWNLLPLCPEIYISALQGCHHAYQLLPSVPLVVLVSFSIEFSHLSFYNRYWGVPS